MVTFVRHILGQRNFYPLYPPDDSMNVDHDLLDQFGMLPNTPHIMILPSSFNSFIKVNYFDAVVEVVQHMRTLDLSYCMINA